MLEVSRLVTRRRVLGTTALAGTGLVLAACAGAATPTTAPVAAPTATTAPAAAATTAPVAEATATTAPVAEATAVPTAAEATGEKVQLHFFTSHGPANCAAWEEIAQNYMQANPTVEITEVQCGVGEQAVSEHLLAQIAAGDPPDVTVIWDSPVSYAARGAMEPLDDLMITSKYSQRENWPANLIDDCVFQGKTYGFPSLVAAYGMYLNIDAFEAQGVSSDPADYPKTLDELRQLSPKFTKWEGDRLETVGFLPQYDEYLLPMWLEGNGGQLYDSENQAYHIDDENNVALLEHAVAWIDDEYMGDIDKVTSSGPWSMGQTEGTGLNAWPAGRMATVMDGSWQINSMYAGMTPVMKWNVALVPYGPNGTKSVAGYWPNWTSVPTGSKVREAAMAYIDYINVEGNEPWTRTVADLPANKKYDRANLKPLPETVAHVGEEIPVAGLNFFFDQLDRSAKIWNSPIQSFHTDQLTRALDQIYHKVATPEAAFAEAQGTCQAELDKMLSSM